MSERKDSKNPTKYLPFGMCLGLSIGTAIGVATDNLAVGMSIGIGMGVCFGALLDRRNHSGKSDTPQAEDMDNER